MQSLGEIEAGQREEGAVASIEPRRPAGEAARKRAAVELIRRHERTLRRTARRYSICADDAEDVYQRALEILLTKAPTADLSELIRWMQTVTKHEALAVRRNRERMLGSPVRQSGEEEQDWVQLLPSPVDGPAAQAERRERIARSREALRTLKPHELRALTLLAEGYSYAEIGEITGWSYTKVNRCLAEGRQRFRATLSSSEEGRRCEDLGPTLSAFSDGEADAAGESLVREHLRACAHCRSKLRTYRAAPSSAAALAPLVPASRSLLERAQELLAGLGARMPGGGGGAETAMSQVAATGGSRGVGMAAIAKVIAACVGTAGGAAACVAVGVVPDLDPLAKHSQQPAVTRGAEDAAVLSQPQTVAEPAAAPTPPPVAPAAEEAARPVAEQEPAVDPPAPPPAGPEPAAAEFSPEATAPSSGSAAPAPTPATTSSGTGGGSSGSSAARTEFGP